MRFPASYSHYDHVLDTALTAGLIPSSSNGSDFDLTQEYFALARGTASTLAIGDDEMVRHELPLSCARSSTITRAFNAHPQHLLSLVSEAEAAGHRVRPVLVGPLTLLALTKSGSRHYHLVRSTASTSSPPSTMRSSASLAAAGVDWIQFDEPALVADIPGTSDEELAEAVSAHLFCPVRDRGPAADVRHRPVREACGQV